VTFKRVNQIVINLFRDLQTQKHMQVGAFYTICRKNGQVHVHVLMIGKGRRRGKFRTLLNVNRKRWKRKWPFIADIQRVYSQNRAIGYLAAQFFATSQRYVLGGILQWQASPKTSHRGTISLAFSTYSCKLRRRFNCG